MKIFKKFFSKLFFGITIIIFSISSVFSQVSEDQFNALVALYNTTDGDNWDNNENWDITNPDADVNSWYGVTVSEGNVTRIELNYNNLSGHIPSQVGNLTHLTRFEVGHNNLSGIIPSSISNMSNLERLRLHSNNLTGEIPDDLQVLNSLERFELNNNSLSGEIPEWIGNFTILDNLQLANNNFSGDVPGSLQNLSNLETLTLQNNDLVSMPDLSDLAGVITLLRLQNNYFHFDDIEPNYVAFNHLSDFSYSPQAKVGDYEEHTLNFGDSFTMSVEVRGSANNYQWFYDGVMIPGADESEYHIASFNSNYARTYHCEVTSGIVSGLVISSEDIVLEYAGDVPPDVETHEPTDITSTTAVLRGEVLSAGGLDVTDRGFYWGLEPNVETTGVQVESGDGLGEFSEEITGLEPGQTYYVKAYAVNDEGEALGDELSFETLAAIPIVETLDAEEIEPYSARLGGEITDDGGSEITQRGIYFGDEENTEETGATINMGDGDGIFSDIIDGLEPGATYYFRAFAFNEAGEALGQEKSFSTPPVIPEVETLEASDILHNSATVGGIVTYDGGTTITTAGIYFHTSDNPLDDGSQLTIAIENDIFEDVLSGLTPATTYYLVAFATNTAGTGYGEMVTFTTEPYIPIVETHEASEITANTAEIHGEVLSAQGADVVERGFYWGTTPYPADEGEKAESGDDIGSFSYNLDNLDANTLYYFQAYAVNNEGTGYGDINSFYTELADQEAWVPNAFRPESSIPENRVFMPVFQFEPTRYTMEIYNRWGARVFSTNDFSIAWDGTSVSGKAPAGAYKYRIIYVDEKGVENVLTGVVNLVR